VVTLVNRVSEMSVGPSVFTTTVNFLRS